MNHPAPEKLAAWVEGRLPEEEARAVREHVAACRTCRVVADTITEIVHSTSPRPRLRWWLVAAGFVLATVLASVLWPGEGGEPELASAPPRTHLRLDFGGAAPEFVVTQGAITRMERSGREVVLLGAERTSDEMLVASVRLSEPVLVDRDSTLRIRFSSNCGPFVACLIPMDRDGVMARIDANGGEVRDVTARFPDSDGERINTICLMAPRAPADGERYLNLEAIEITSSP
ncbi:MAG: zf-HC2 domain-containing protein [Planctomycetota bacterium]|jgi:hypothetical protein